MRFLPNHIFRKSMSLLLQATIAGILPEIGIFLTSVKVCDKSTNDSLTLLVSFEFSNLDCTGKNKETPLFDSHWNRITRMTNSYLDVVRHWQKKKEPLSLCLHYSVVFLRLFCIKKKPKFSSNSNKKKNTSRSQAQVWLRENELERTLQSCHLSFRTRESMIFISSSNSWLWIE